MFSIVGIVENIYFLTLQSRYYIFYNKKLLLIWAHSNAELFRNRNVAFLRLFLLSFVGGTSYFLLFFKLSSRSLLICFLSCLICGFECFVLVFA